MGELPSLGASVGVGVGDVADGPGEVELAHAFFAAGEVNSASVLHSHIVRTPGRSGGVLSSMPKKLVRRLVAGLRLQVRSRGALLERKEQMLGLQLVIAWIHLLRSLFSTIPGRIERAAFMRVS